MPLSAEWNQKRYEAWTSYPTVQAFFQRVRDHPPLANHFKERPGDDEVDF